ncbi:MAG TPA: hypothetical protein VJM69_06215, partial [Dehalococcoidia bacterium]|nr:hypothetical protein [Dehalococcoidia bacterium]
MRQWLLGLGILVGLLALAACAAEEKATPAPASPTAAAKPAWEQEWEQVLAAARREGKIALAGPSESGLRRALTEPFQKKYGITVEYLAATGSELAPRIKTEREAGQYLWDIHIGGNFTMIQALKPMGALDPLEPALILPEVKEPKNWRGGNLPLVDKDRLILR